MQSYLDWSCPWDAAVKPNLYEDRLEDRRSSIECDIIVVWKKEIERDWHKRRNEGNGEERSGKRLEQGDRSDKIIHNSNSHIFDIFQVSFLLFIKKKHSGDDFEVKENLQLIQLLGSFLPNPSQARFLLYYLDLPLLLSDKKIKRRKEMNKVYTKNQMNGFRYLSKCKCNLTKMSQKWSWFR